MKIVDYIISLHRENIQVSKIKSVYTLETNESSFDITTDDGTTKQISMELGCAEDSQVVEFYDQNNNLVARAKGFDSVL